MHRFLVSFEKKIKIHKKSTNSGIQKHSLVFSRSESLNEHDLKAGSLKFPNNLGKLIQQFVEITTPLREITCHVGSNSVTCHPAAVNFPPLFQLKPVLDLVEGC